MDKDYPILKRASASRSSGEWNDDDFDVLADGSWYRSGTKRRHQPARSRAGDGTTGAT